MSLISKSGRLLANHRATLKSLAFTSRLHGNDRQLLRIPCDAAVLTESANPRYKITRAPSQDLICTVTKMG
jgi:hypothetical protein